MVQLPEVVSVGEIGLDLNRNYSPQEVQESVFEKQVCVLKGQLAVKASRL